MFGVVEVATAVVVVVDEAVVVVEEVVAGCWSCAVEPGEELHAARTKSHTKSALPVR